jgi:hypothetical protein
MIKPVRIMVQNACQETEITVTPPRPPVDRRKGGLRRSVASYGYGISAGNASDPGNRHDSQLLAPNLIAATASRRRRTLRRTVDMAELVVGQHGGSGRVGTYILSGASRSRCACRRSPT